MKLLDDPSTYDKILAYLEDPENNGSGLTGHERELATRYQDAYVMYRDTKSRSEAAAKLMKIHGISRAQAFRSVSAGISLFGDAAKLTLQGVRHMVSEIFLEAIEMARRQHDPGEMIKGAKELGRAWNIHNPLEETLRDMQPHTYVVNLDPQSLNSLHKMLNSGNVDFNQFLQNLPIQDADYTEIKDRSEESGG